MEYPSQRVTHIIFQLFVGNSDQFWRLVKGHFAWTKPSMGMSRMGRMGRMVLATCLVVHLIYLPIINAWLAGNPFGNGHGKIICK